MFLNTQFLKRDRHGEPPSCRGVYPVTVTTLAQLNPSPHLRKELVLIRPQIVLVVLYQGLDAVG